MKKRKIKNIFPNLNGSGYRYRFKINGKEYTGQCANCETEEDAFMYLCRVKKDIADEASGIKVREDRTFKLADAAKKYKQYSVEQASHLANMRYLKAFINYFGENKIVMSLDHTQMRKYRKHLRKYVKLLKNGQTEIIYRDNKTINLYVGSIHKMLNLCVAEHKISYNPISGLEELKIKPHRTRILFDDEQVKLFEVIAKKGYKDLGDTIITRLCTAMRQGEVFNLAWKYINLSERVMNIYRQKTNNWTKLYILDPLYNILLERQNNNSEWVFPNPKTGKPYTKMDKSFNIVKELAGIQEYIRQHDFRRTAATWMYEEGIDIHVIKVILGHSDIRTTERYLGIRQKVINESMKTISSHILIKPNFDPDNNNTQTPLNMLNSSQVFLSDIQNSKGEKRGKIIRIDFKRKSTKGEPTAL